jgi:hypothetical protein
MRHNFFFLLMLLFAAGCVSTTPPENHSPRPANLFPANAFLTQRAVLTVRDREFTLNGYLALSETGGQRLIVTDNFGDVIADVLIKLDGKIFVMRSSRMFPEKWVRNYVAADLETIFGRAPLKDWPVEKTGESNFLLQRRGYSLYMRIVEAKLGAQPAEMFDETKALEK